MKCISPCIWVYKSMPVQLCLLPAQPTTIKSAFLISRARAAKKRKATYSSSIPLRSRLPVFLASFSICKTEGKILLRIWVTKLRRCLEVTLQYKHMLALATQYPALPEKKQHLRHPSSYPWEPPNHGRNTARLHRQQE